MVSGSDRVAHRGDDVDERHLGDDGREQVGAHGHARADEQAAGAAAADDDAVRRRPAGGDEVLAAGDGVGERVALVRAACRRGTSAGRARRRRAGGRAPTSSRGRAARTGPTENHGGISTRSCRSRTRSTARVPSAAASTRRTMSTGHPRAVGGRRPLAAGACTATGRRSAPASASAARARRSTIVLFVDRRRRRERLVRRSAASRCAHSGFASSSSSCGSSPRSMIALAAVAAQDRAAAAARRATRGRRGESANGSAPSDPPAGHVGDELGPLAGRVERRGHHAEVLGVEVGEHDEAVAPVVDVVLEVGSRGRARPVGARSRVAGRDRARPRTSACSTTR